MTVVYEVYVVNIVIVIDWLYSEREQFNSHSVLKIPQIVLIKT
jgi:hypothetical protein